MHLFVFFINGYRVLKKLPLPRTHVACVRDDCVRTSSVVVPFMDQVFAAITQGNPHSFVRNGKIFQETISGTRTKWPVFEYKCERTLNVKPKCFGKIIMKANLRFKIIQFTYFFDV